MQLYRHVISIELGHLYLSIQLHVAKTGPVHKRTVLCVAISPHIYLVVFHSTDFQGHLLKTINNDLHQASVGVQVDRLFCNQRFQFTNLLQDDIKISHTLL